MPGSREHRYPCERCGASLQFQPGQEMLSCDYCGHSQRIGETSDEPQAPTIPPPDAALQWDAGHKSPELVELPLEDGLNLDASSRFTEEIRTLSCPNCGAQIEMNPDLHASACPFCATPVVTDTGTTRRIKPQGVLPFVLTEKQAHAAMENWLGRLWFAPNGLLDYARKGRKMTGIYSPFWTFDADTQSEYTGMRGDAYYVSVPYTRRVNGRTERGTRQERRIRWHNVGGQVSRRFNDVLVLASTSLPRKYADGLKPWDLAALTSYRPEYLSGFNAEGYTVSLDHGHQTGRQEMARVIMNDARRDIGGDEQRINQIRTDYSAETFKHVLLPVWTAAYKYNGKSYRFVVNGQSGRVQGERPWSVVKIALAVIAGLVALAGILYLSDVMDDSALNSSGLSGDYIIQSY